MTADQQSQLSSLFNQYNSKKSTYETAHNATVSAMSNPSSPANGRLIFQCQEAEISAKSSMDAALIAYNSYKTDVERQDQAAFIAANPQVAVQIESARANAQATAQVGTAEAQAKASLESQAKTFMQENTKYLIAAGIVITVLIVGTFIYLKIKKS